MRIAVLASGEIGGYYGAFLAKAGHDVAFIARGAHLEAVQRRGLTVRTSEGESTIPVTAVADTRSVGPVDLVLFCVKSYDTEPAAQALAPAKAGVAMLTKTIAVHYAKDGIRCNGVAPAVTETPLTESRLKDSAVRKAMEVQYPLGRLGRADDVVQAVLYLASDDASWTTGTILTVDGEIMAQ